MLYFIRDSITNRLTEMIQAVDGFLPENFEVSIGFQMVEPFWNITTNTFIALVLRKAEKALNCFSHGYNSSIYMTPWYVGQIFPNSE